jgi:hypothetical protein
MRSWFLVLPAALLPLALAACSTHRSHAPAGMAAAQPVHLVPQRTWRVVEGAQVLGLVVLFEAERDSRGVAPRYYSIRNPLEQELGTIDGLGRAWRFEPHTSEPRWVATGTLIEGARAILSAGAGAALVEVPIREKRAGSARE